MLKRLFVFVIFLATPAWATAKADFSGSYAAQHKKGDKALTPSLRVIQTDSTVQVTRIYGGKSVTNIFPLDGSEGDYTTETGVRGKCSAQLNGETLVLKTLAGPPPKANTPSLRFEIIEKWRLSPDNKKLTIKTDIKSPDMPNDVITAAFPDNPQTEKYQRLDLR
jgi:hypothetical protein